MLNKSVCAPNIIADSHYTCFTKKELEDIANSFNKFIKKNDLCREGVCIRKRPININQSKAKLWKSIFNRLSEFCKYEYCWIDLEFIDVIPDKELRERLKFFVFKPKMTKTNHAWLSNSDIEYIMRQYENYDSNFYFIGAKPSDFYKIEDVDYDKIIDYRMVGIVLNLDGHKKSGSHWVSIVVDNEEGTIEYFDSVGDVPKGNIRQFVKKLREVLPYHSYMKNVKEHQKENNECGVYSVYFIIQRLLGLSFEEINSKRIKDRDMNKLRRYLFRPRK